MSRSKRGRASPAAPECASSSLVAWKSMETLLCKELGSCDYEAALFTALPASTQGHILDKWSMYKPKVAHVRRELEMAYKLRFNTEDIPDEIAALAENKAPLGLERTQIGISSAPTTDMQQLPFSARLLLLWHVQRPAQIPELVQLLARRSDLEHAENILRARCESTRRCIATSLSGKYRVVLQIEFQKSSTLVRLSDVGSLPVLTFADACLESGRLVKVKLPKPKNGKTDQARSKGRGGTQRAPGTAAHDDHFLRLAQHGFRFAGEHFDAFGSKDPHSLSWYFVRRKEDADVANAAALRDVMGNWRTLRCASALACRLELALGGVALGLKLEDSQLELIEDVMANCSAGETDASQRDDDAVLTDGSGFISPELAALICPRVSQGQETGTSSEQPAAYQIRLICRLGCFKGTLVVNQNIRNKVQLRRSMLKIPPACCEDELDGLDGYNRLLVVNTSREPNSDAELNKHLLLVLPECAPDEMHRTQLISYFGQLLQDNIDSLAGVTCERSAAYRYCSLACQSNDDASLNLNSLSSVMEMLLAGHDLQQPYLASVLHKHLRQDWDRLQSLRIQCPNSCYLMGIPDPTRSLGPGEVYVRPHRSSAALVGPVIVTRFPLVLPSSVASLRAVESACIDAFLCARAGVIVFSCQSERRPVADMGGDYDGDLYYVNWNPIVTACLPPNEACVPRRSPLATQTQAELPHTSNVGDTECEFECGNDEEDDGENDEYAGYNHSIPLVQPVVDITSAMASSAPSQRHSRDDVPLSSVLLKQLLDVSVNEIPEELVGSVLMQEWLQFLRNDNTGISATQWLIHADKHGVRHANTIAWARLHEQSLSARKHATAVGHCKLPQSNTYPDFMGKPAAVCYPSTSILGTMHNAVLERTPLLEQNFEDLTLDKDMFHRKARNYIQTLNGWVSEYAQSVSAIMSETSDESERQMRIEELVLRYERIHQALVEAESRRPGMSVTEAEEAIASALYEVCCLRFNEMAQRSSKVATHCKPAKTIASYFTPPRKPPIHYLRFCWRLCGPVLNRLKIQARTTDHLTNIMDSLQTLRLSQDTQPEHGSAQPQSSELINISRQELALLIQALRQT